MVDGRRMRVSNVESPSPYCDSFLGRKHLRDRIAAYQPPRESKGDDGDDEDEARWGPLS